MDIFKQFLIRNHLYDKFVQNLKNLRKISYEEYRGKHKLTTDNLILGSFDWTNSIEGCRFWYDVDEEWINLYKKLLIYEKNYEPWIVSNSS